MLSMERGAAYRRVRLPPGYRYTYYMNGNNFNLQLIASNSAALVSKQFVTTI